MGTGIEREAGRERDRDSPRERERDVRSIFVMLLVKQTFSMYTEDGRLQNKT